jgi:hypothetical protein
MFILNSEFNLIRELLVIRSLYHFKRILSDIYFFNPHSILYKTFIRSKFDELFAFDIQKFKDTLKFDDSNFQKAINSGNEIMIHGKYYIVNTAIFRFLKNMRLL